MATSDEVPPELKAAAQKLQNGETVPPISVRELLGYFQAQRRGFYIVETITGILNDLKITTDPDFRDVWIDAEIRLLPASPSEIFEEGIPGVASGSEANASAENQSATGDMTGVPDHTSRDPTFKIGVLEAANREVVSVKPDEPLSLAITRMLARDYSQLPVMTTPREVKGIVSWFSIGARITLNDRGTAAVRHSMEKAYVVDADEGLLGVLPVIIDRGYVLVRGGDNCISGIVTAADVSMEFKQRAEPFLLLSEIEQHIRNLLGGKISIDELRAVKNPTDSSRSVDRVSDLTFFEYILIFQNPALWQKLTLDGEPVAANSAETGKVIYARSPECTVRN
jgi:CBS domain-containing protein